MTFPCNPKKQSGVLYVPGISVRSPLQALHSKSKTLNLNPQPEILNHKPRQNSTSQAVAAECCSMSVEEGEEEAWPVPAMQGLGSRISGFGHLPAQG